MSAALASILSPSAFAEVAGLRATVYADLRAKAELLRPVLELRRGHCAALRALSRSSGHSFATLYRWFTAARAGDWRALTDCRRDTKLWTSDAAIALPLEDAETFRRYCDANQRKIEPAWRRMVRDWRAGRIQTTQPIDPSTSLPVGWSLSNLRRHAPTPFERRTTTIGRGAAFTDRPLVLSTRVGLHFGEFFLFDDDEFDIETTFIGVATRVMRPLGLSAVEALSGCHSVLSFKPTLFDEDSGRKKKLLQRDMHLLVAQQLIHVGYRAAGCTLIFEHGTANTGSDFIAAISALTAGAVTVRRSGMEGRQAHAGLFEGRGRGNFRFKALRESMGNLVRNEMADAVEFPGQVGRDRVHSPEATWGSRRYTERLLQAAAQLPPELAAALRYPRLDWPTFTRLAFALYDRIDRRTDHALEGWAELGHIAHEWRLQATPESPWIPWDRALALPDRERAAVEALVTADPLLYRTRLLSPREVFARHQGGLARLPASILPVLLPDPDFWQPVTVRRDHTIRLTPERGASAITYLARLPDGTWMRPGTELRAWVLPSATGALPVADQAGRWLAELPVLERVTRSDTQAATAAIATVRRAEGELLAPLVRRASAQVADTLALRRHNRDVLAAAAADPSAPTPAQRARVTRTAAAGAADLTADDIAAALAHAPADPAPEPLDYDEAARLFGD